MTTAGEPISTSRTRHPDVEPGASAMASRAANLQCRTGDAACTVDLAPDLARQLDLRDRVDPRRLAVISTIKRACVLT
jgi:hypothetical protein